jgi:hypothetical protein
MQAAMQVYASFALIILAIVAIIAFATVVSAALRALRRLLGSSEDFRTSRTSPGASSSLSKGKSRASRVDVSKGQ